MPLISILIGILFMSSSVTFFECACSQECANLEKIRENMVKEGQEVCYDKWAKAAGVDEAVLKSRLQAGYCCRERLLVTTEWLVKYIARTYTGMGTAFEDLLQVASLYF